jgi:hypothetical protein
MMMIILIVIFVTIVVNVFCSVVSAANVFRRDFDALKPNLLATIIFIMILSELLKHSLHSVYIYIYIYSM